MEMEKTYQPQLFEKKVYKTWEDKQLFKAKIDKNKLPYTMVMPPPNITGQLHMGHALNDTIQDVIIRYKRMQGYSALWLPGTDHASIATELKIVEMLKKEGLTKNDVGRDGFLVRAWEWKNTYGNRIVEQLKYLGSSCDWSRLAFTMDERCSNAVKEVFVNLYEKGLIYQGDRIINWCPECKTALSDAEVDYVEEDSHLWHLKYPLKDGSGYIVVATTRPETMLGDTAVAVNPKDKRYRDMVGKMLVLPLVNKEIPVIADEYVEMEFGTGAVKITPAHDPNDFEVGLRHDLEVIRVMNDDGTMNENAGKYQGMQGIDAREKIVDDLKELGLLVKIEDIKHNVGHCYRCKHAVEPIVSKQWFVKMKPLAEPAIDVVKNKNISFVPKRFSKVYYNWMENVRDWCISRQLWWGHRIPAYYCDDCGEIIVSKNDVNVCPKCNGKNIRQDEDVLDTWFSSALWPFSTLGYPEKTADLDYFYPTDILVTAYDIIFFWVARMIFSGVEHMQRIPFKDVLIHGIVRDSEGRKMSKSLGNGIDPIEIIDKYGADSLRFSLINGIAPGNDTRFSEDKLDGAKKFMNKVWNASRFVIMNVEGKKLRDIKEVKLNNADKWIISRLNKTIKKVSINIDKYELGTALSTLYDFVWSDFCDWYIELTKPVLYGDDQNKINDTASVLLYVLKQTLKLLHPFIPFVTEEIYSNCPNTNEYLITSDYPRYSSKDNYSKQAKNMDMIMSIIKAVRNVKTRFNAPPSKKVKIFVVSNQKTVINSSKSYIEKLAGVSEISFVNDKSEILEKTAPQVIEGCEMYVCLGDLIDAEKEIIRLQNELNKVENDIAFIGGRLSNEGFVNKAPKALVENEREKYETALKIKEKLLKELADLK